MRRVVATSAPLHVVELVRRDGERESAADASPGSGETFLLVHGYGATSYIWRHWVDALARRGRVVLVDLKGFGSAPKPDDGRYSPADLANELVALMAEMDLREVTLFGQSLGGGIALLVALRLLDLDEQRLRRLVLLAPAAYPQRLPPFVWLSHRPRLATGLLRVVGPERVVRWAARAVVHDPASVTDDAVADYARALATPEGRRSALAVGRAIVPPDLDRLSARYPEIDVPTLLVWGDRDPVVPLALGRRLARALPDAELVVLDRCGHVAPEEHPDASLEAVETFLDRTRRASPENDGSAARP